MITWTRNANSKRLPNAAAQRAAGQGLQEQDLLQSLPPRPLFEEAGLRGVFRLGAHCFAPWFGSDLDG